MRLVLFFLGLCFSLKDVSAQKPLFPVKVNHQWQFVDVWGDTPKKFKNLRFDELGDRYLPWNFYGKKRSLSPFRLVELDGKVGLIDANLNQVLDCRFKRIRLLSELYFAVEVDSLFTVIDQQYNLLLGESKYEEVSSVDSTLHKKAGYFLVKKDGKWGIHENGGELTVPPQYAEIRLAYGSDWFKVKKLDKDTLWGLINAKNEQILPFNYYDILVLRPDFIAVSKQQSPNWQIIDQKSHIKMEGLYRDVKMLNENLVELDTLRSNSWKIWHLGSQKYLKLRGSGKIKTTTNGQLVYPIKRIKSDNQKLVSYTYGLLDPTGNNIGENYDSIVPAGIEGIFRVLRDHKWGLMNTNPKGLSLKPKYDQLTPFYDSLAFVNNGSNKWSVINLDTLEVVRPIYSSFEMKDGLLYASHPNGTLYVFECRTKGMLLPRNSISNLQKTAINKGDYYDITLPPGLKTTRTFIEIGKPAGKMDITLMPIDTSKYMAIGQLDLRFETVSAMYNKLASVQNSFTQTFAPFTKKLCEMIIGDKNKKIKKGLPEMLGLRWSDFMQKSPYAAFVDKNGQMGLMSEKWQELKNEDGIPYRFSYVSPLQYIEEGDGFFIARVCLGGQISKDGLDARYACGTNRDLVSDYTLLEPNNLKLEISEASTKPVFVVPSGAVEPRWGILNITTGKFIVKPQYDFIDSYSYEDDLALVYRDKLCGAINYNGDTIFAIKHPRLTRFKGFFKITAPETCGYLFDAEGHQLSVGSYTDYAGYTEGYCAVKDSNNLWGFIDTNGNEVVKCLYRQVKEFSEGLAAVTSDGKIWTFIKTNGDTAFVYGRILFKKAEDDMARLYKVKFDPEKQKKLRFKDGRCLFYDLKCQRWGYLNTKGDTVIRPTYEAATEFSNGRALVRKGLITGKVNAIIIDTAEHPLNRAYFYIWPINQYGVAVATEKANGKFGLISRDGEPITKMEYDSIRPFYEGYAAAKTIKGWRLLRFDGVEHFQGTYVNMGLRVSEGLINVSTKKPGQDEQWFYIDTLGNKPFDPNICFKAAKSFKGGLAEVNNHEFINRTGQKLIFAGKKFEHYDGIFFITAGNQKTYFADSRGNALFDQEYSSVIGGANGLVFIEQGEKGAVNKRGFMVIPPKYNSLIPKGDHIVSKTNKRIGLIDKYGKEILSPKFDKLDVFSISDGDISKKVIRAESGEKVEYFWSDGARFLPGPH